MAEFRRFQCEECERAFVRPAELERHREKVHEDSPYLFCQHQSCSFKSVYYRSLARHIEQKHGCTKRESKREGGDAQVRADERLMMNKAATMPWLDQDQDDDTRRQLQDWRDVNGTIEEEHEPEAEEEYSIELLCQQFNKINIC